MTIDERIEKLTERHEAVAESAQILTANIRELIVHRAQTDAQIRALGVNEGRMMDAIARLAHVAGIR
jgi:prefoldin subunit 5